MRDKYIANLCGTNPIVIILLQLKEMINQQTEMLHIKVI